MGIAEAVRPAFQPVWSAARKNLEAMPEDGFDFRPDGLETRSLREIALHMANACVTFGENIGKNPWERIMAFPPEEHTSKANVLHAMARGGERFLAGVDRLTDEEARRVVLVPWGMEMPQGTVVSGHVPHMYYHNGQLALYLRMRGIRPFFLVR